MTEIADDHDENSKESNVSTPSPKQPLSLVEFFRQSPLVDLEIDLERDKSPGRDIDLGFDDQEES